MPTSTKTARSPAAHRARRLQAAWQIVIADVSMSLDNVLAVAGAARDHPTVLIIGLILSIALMGIAANFIARLLHRHRWIAYVGLLIILYVALDMIYRGIDRGLARSSTPQPEIARSAPRSRLIASSLHRVRRHLHEFDAVAVGILDPALAIVVRANLRLDGQPDAGLRAAPPPWLRDRRIPGRND